MSKKDQKIQAMAGEWRELAWGDLATLEYGRALRGHAQSKGRFRVFGTNGPIGWRDEPLCPHPTVVIGRKGAYRGVHFSPGPCFVIDTAFYLKPKSEFDIRWAFYALLTQDINGMDSGSAIPSTSREAFYKLAVRVPPLPEQRAIAHILGTLDDRLQAKGGECSGMRRVFNHLLTKLISGAWTVSEGKDWLSWITKIVEPLDDKIELNRRMSETLEQMARALFKSWFIDFDPVRRNMARARGQNQPSPPAPLPGGEGGGHYRGGYDFAGLVETARALRKKQTPAEAVFWELVRDRRFLGLKFRRQHQLGDYVADFYCHEHRLVIEFDGGVHSEKQHKDHKRDAWMKAQGIRVLRFPNKQLLNEPESILTTIAQVVEATAKTLPLAGGRGAGIPPSPFGRRAGDEGSVEALDRLFPDRLVDSELGEIPEGWGVGRVDDEFDLTMGQSPPGETYNETGGGMPFYQGRADFGARFPKRRIYCTAPTKLARKNDSLISVRAPVGDVNMAGEDCAIGRGIAAARHKSGSRSYTYQFMLGLEGVFAQFEAEGTVFGSITKRDFHAIPCVVPPPPVIYAFEALLDPVDSRIEMLANESETLAALRDALLPKLISGEMRVKDAERFVSEIADKTTGVLK